MTTESKVRKFYLVLGLSFVLFSPVLQTYSKAMDSCTASIQTVEEDNRIIISGLCSCQQETKIHYDLSVKKKSSSGTSNLHQAGSELCKASIDMIIGKIVLNKQPGNAIDIKLIISSKSFGSQSIRKTIKDTYPI